MVNPSVSSGTAVLTPDQARSLAQETLALNPQDAESLLAMARLERHSNNIDAALEWFDKACKAAPLREDALAEYGFLLHSNNQTKDAIGYLRRALQINPHNSDAQKRLAMSCQVEGYYAEAERIWAGLIATTGDTESRLNRGILRRITGRYREAVQDLELACATLPRTHPQWGRAQAALGMSLLCLGEWARGWTAYEARLTYPGAAQTGICNYEGQVPMWDGGPIQGKTLAVLAEQGLGDVLQFCRYILPLSKTGAFVYFSCYPPLIPLIEQSFPTLRVISNNTVIDANLYAPLLSLPHLLQPILGELPYSPIPYLQATPEKIDFFGKKVAELSKYRRRFGVAWAGNPEYAGDKARSIPPQLMAAVIDAVDADFFVIQPNCDLTAFNELGITNLHNLSAELHSFADTAALMMALDGVISVDTSVIHLAGALGQSGWLLLPTDNDWRWGLGSTTPWYPSLRILRQKTHGDWNAPLMELAKSLIAFI